MSTAPIAPGEFLRDELQARGLGVCQFAEMIGRPCQVVSQILNGRKAITTETAFQLADALGTSPEVWLNLQTSWCCAEYRLGRRPLR